MPTINKFIIALCPATPIYLGGGSVTSDRATARVFDTHDEAMAVITSVKGWAGASRVEQIAVEVPEVPSLATPAARIEARDAATFAFHEEADRLQDNDAGLLAAVQALRDLGYRAASEDGDTINVADPEGNLLDLDWDPNMDGFDYATSGDDGCDLDEIEANTEDEPADADAEERAEQDESPVALAEARIAEAIEAIDGLIEESADIGRDAAVLLLAELIALAKCKGMDWKGIQDAAWATVCTCDGCCEDKPMAEMNYVGECFAFCAACRAKDANAPRA